MISMESNHLHINKLIDYCISHGCTLNHISIIYRSEVEGNTITAQKNMSCGEILVKIPFDLCISVSSILQYDRLKIIFDENHDLLQYPDEILALGIMYAKLESLREISDVHQISPWYYHVQTFSNHINTPLFWNSEEIEETKPTNVYHLTKMLQKQIEMDFNTIHKPLSEVYSNILGGITLDLYKWALSIIYSRAVGIERKKVYTRCIPPILDMANHYATIEHDTYDTINYDESTDCVYLLSPKKVEVGEECLAIYGPYCNSKLLYNYGFIIHGNPHRSIDLWTKVSPSSYQAARKQSLLQSHELTRNQSYDFSGTIRSNHYVSVALLATIRVIQICDEEEFEKAENAFIGNMISIRNELASYNALKGLLVARMKVDMAEDDKKSLGEMLLNGMEQNNRKFMSLVIRVDERELLQETIQLVDNWIDQLSSDSTFRPVDYKSTVS